MNKEINLKETIWNFIDKYKNIIFLVLITIMALVVRQKLMYFKSDDFLACIEPWYNELKDNGGLVALNREIGNYNPPYLTLLAILTYTKLDAIICAKGLSILFDFICAFTVMKIVNILFKDSKHKKFYGLMSYTAVLFLPTVLLNASCWGQADSIYTAFILLSIRYLLESKYFRAFLFLGLSFAFKLQFAFILPLYIYMYISERKFPIWYFLIIPVVNIISYLPAIIAGRSLSSCLAVYFGQTEGAKYFLSLNFPGIWNLVFPFKDEAKGYVYAPDPNISSFALYLTIAIFGVMAFIILYRKVKFDKQKIIEFGLWSVVTATFFLPYMHDRYLFVGDILSILYFLYNRDKIYIPIGISAVSTYCYMKYLFDYNSFPMTITSAIYAVIFVLLTKDIYKKYLKIDEKVEE